MKQFATSVLHIRFPKVNAEEITQADFVIKEKIERDAYPFVKARYMKNSSESNEEESTDILKVDLDGDVFSFIIPPELTSQMPVSKDGRSVTLWLDTRVKVGEQVLDTRMQRIRIKPTLFSEDYEEEGGEW